MPHQGRVGALLSHNRVPKSSQVCGYVLARKSLPCTVTAQITNRSKAITSTAHIG